MLYKDAYLGVFILDFFNDMCFDFNFVSFRFVEFIVHFQFVFLWLVCLCG
jgi:hypothetical protein